MLASEPTETQKGLDAVNDLVAIAGKQRGATYLLERIVDIS